MGWTGMNRVRPADYRKFFTQEFNEVEFLDFARKGNTCYAIAKRNDEIFGVVILTAYSDWEFRYKEMTEHSGPYESSPPKRLLDTLERLSTPPNDYAKEWRARCRRNLSKRPLKHGDVIKLPYKLDFTHGCGSEDTFTVVKEGRAKRYIMKGSGRKVRITNINRRDYRLIDES